MPNDRLCPECGQPLPEGALAEVCPVCSLQGVLKLTSARTPEVQPPPAAVPEPSASPPPALPRFGDYELQVLLARGGMGVVYKARQISLNRPVALKRIAAGVLATPAEVIRFHTEAEAIAHLQHPNIVAVHEIGEHDREHYFSMDYVAGRTLAEVVREGPLPAARAAGYVQTIARAVHYAHQQGVIHRDLKPANVIIDEHDQPHITDFGLAKLLTSDFGLRTPDLTTTGQVLGSPNYLPPEQAEPHRGAIGPPSDVYALGAILYHLVTGRPPFQAQSLTTLLRQVIENEPVPPRLLNPNIPRDLETICLKCLQKEPTRRYASAQALAEDLECWLRAEPIQARRATQVERVWLWCRRQPVRASLIGALALALVLGLSGVLWQWNRAKAEELRARQNAYAADMNLVQAALEKSDLGGAWEALNRQRPLPGQKDLRGWEWRYFWQRCRSEERFLLCRCPGQVGALAFSANGKWLAIRSEGGTVTLWDAVHRQRLAGLSGAGNSRAMALSPAEDFLAYGSVETNGTPIMSLCGLADQRELARVPYSAAVAHCSFSPDGSLLATWAEDGMVSLLQTKPRQVLTNFLTAKLPPSHGRILFSPNGQFLAVGQQNEILLWEWASGTQRRIAVPKIGDAVTTLAFSPDGRLLAAACSRIQVWDVSNVWNLPTGSEVPLLGQSDQLPNWINDLAFAPDGKTLATAESDPRIGLWDVKTLTQLRQFQGNTHAVWTVVFSPDGKDLVTGAQDGSVRYFDAVAEPVWPSPAVVPMPVWCPAFTFAPDSKHFIALDKRDGVGSLWSLVPLRQLERLSFLGTNNSAVRWSPDGRLLAVGDESGNVRVWDYSTRQAVTNFTNPGFRVGFLKVQGSGRTLFCGLVSLTSGTVGARFWDTRTWSEIRLPPDFPDGSSARWAAVSADNRILAALDDQGTVAWWEMASGRRLARFEHHFAIRDGYLMFSPVSPLLAGSAKDGQTTIWDVTTGRIVADIRANFKAVHGVAFSPDGKRLLSGGEDAKDVVRLLDLSSQRHVATLTGPPEEFWFLEMSPDLNMLVAVGIVKTALLWRAPSWAEIEAAERRENLHPGAAAPAEDHGD